jgi:hypothetical protein
MKLPSHLMKLLHFMTLPSQQFYLCGILFNVHDTLMKHVLRLALEALKCTLIFGIHKRNSKQNGLRVASTENKSRISKKLNQTKLELKWSYNSKLKVTI